MYKLIYLFLLFSATATAAPFSSVWNIDNSRLHGAPKSITEETEYSKYSKKVKVYNFSRDGDLISQVTLNGKASPAFVTELEYDIAGNLKAMHVRKVSSNSNLLSEQAEYERGKLASITRLNSEGKVESTSDISCYPNRLVKSINLNSKLNSTSWEFKFDDHKQLIASIFKENGKIMIRKSFTNDSHGNPVKIITLNKQTGSKVVTDLKYSYDSKGNWIKCTQTINSSWGGDSFKRQVIINRKIKYFS
ncbi:hypothetical protein P0136_04275 [Lentisphaerota bacterium ZTH]|nr:hypothetical protein JYG24_04610 [Lentisphaerota bacterium]WET07211.1 hypothetical protein P0136_04275 [Lentisphaerota bacterium ZTH]